MTDDPELRVATSVVDYIFRRLAVGYVTYEERQVLGVLTTEDRRQPTLHRFEEVVTASSSIVEDLSVDEVEGAGSALWGRPAGPAAVRPAPIPHLWEAGAPLCYECRLQIQRGGSCFAGPRCGTTSGRS
jgi:ribonucleoside-diphosphate reductase alpha chain